MSHSHSHSHGHEELGHVVPEATFFKILMALLVLTIVTVLAAQVDLGKWNIVGAIVIATIKATLVISVFMHGKYENKIILTYMIIPFILLVIMILGVFTDDPFRDHPLPFGAEAGQAAAPAAPKAAAHH
jgi:cytochrome c oxidase subunit 4